MRRLIVLGLSGLAVLFLVKTILDKKNLGVDPDVGASRVDSEDEQIVYIGASGTKYHQPDCPPLGDTKKSMKLADAVAAGYGPCKLCMS
jgi:hypothetical protein